MPQPGSAHARRGCRGVRTMFRRRISLPCEPWAPQKILNPGRGLGQLSQHGSWRDRTRACGCVPWPSGPPQQQAVRSRTSAVAVKVFPAGSVGAGYIERNWPPALKDAGAWPLASLRQSFLRDARWTSRTGADAGDYARARCIAIVTGHTTPEAWYIRRMNCRIVVLPTRSKTPFSLGCQWSPWPHCTNWTLPAKRLTIS